MCFLRKAGEISQWDLDAWPLKKAVELHIAHTDERLFPRLSANIVKELYYHSHNDICAFCHASPRSGTTGGIRAAFRCSPSSLKRCSKLSVSTLFHSRAAA